MKRLFTHIEELVCVAQNPHTTRKAGADMADAESIRDAFLSIVDGRIQAFGPMQDLQTAHVDDVAETIDASGRCIFPGYVDSHTHLVFAATREQEFKQRLSGLSYQEIAAAGGGILNSAAKTQATAEQALFESALRRLEEVIRMGTTTLEIKSGYGLTVEAELKLLRVANRLKQVAPIDIAVTCLAAHALPTEYKQNRGAYIKLLTQDLLPKVVDEGLAEYVDVFCEEGFFSVEESRTVLEAGLKLGLKARVHANELAFSGGVQLGVELGALSVDHLECVGEAELAALANSTTIPTLLPTTAFFLGIEYAPARKLIEAGLPVALATDYNPGTSPSGNMNLVLSTACTQMKLTPAEAMVASTLNTAASLERSHEVGSLAVGKRANFWVSEPDVLRLERVPYSFGRPLVGTVYLDGEPFEGLDVML